MAPTYNCIRAHIVISILPRWDLKTRKNVWRKTKNEITSWFAPKPTLYLGAKHSSVSWTFYWKMIIYPPWNQQIASENREGLFAPSDPAKPETTHFPPFQRFV